MRLPADTSLDELKIKIKAAYTNPNVGNINQIVLKEGPRAFRIATLLEIRDPKTSEFHHYSLKLDSIDRRKDGWFAKPERSIRLEGDNPNELERLCNFLQTALKGSLANADGDLHIIRSEDYQKLETLISALPKLALADKVQLVQTVLNQVETSSASVPDFIAALKNSSTKLLTHIATASRFLEYRKQFDELKKLVDDPSSTEPMFQSLLSANSWMFGSEYSELLSRRTWTRDDNLDYMLRCTVDRYLEIVEIKTAFTESLFNHNITHDSYYPSAKLSAVLGQVMRYIEEVERNRNSIIATDKVDPLKIRAKVILGRDGDAKKQEALRKFNSHLHGIEILTFDQLLKIAGRVLEIFESAAEQATEVENDDDVPF